MGEQPPVTRVSATARRRVGLAAGPVAYAAVRLAPPPGLDAAAAATLACTLWVAFWWLTEAAPLSATALLPVVLFPVSGVTNVAATAAAYTDPVTFLFLGGFLVALAIERWGLHRRIALAVVAAAGDDPARLLAGFMGVTAFLSMWVSNTATAMLMVPIGLAVTGRVSPGPTPATDAAANYVANSLAPPDVPQTPLGTALMLGIAYAATVGGVATLIGTPPNAILAAVLERSLGLRVDFFRWMLFGVPFAAVMLVVTWRVLVWSFPLGGRSLDVGAVDGARAALGPMTTAERRVLAVFALVVVGWLTRPFLLDPFLPGFSDAGVAVVGGVTLFVVPSGSEEGGALLAWEDTSRLPWGVLLVFGAGFAVADAFRATGLDAWVGSLLGGLGGLPTLLAFAVVAAVVVFLTEVTSNSATASLFVPLAIGVAASLAVSPAVLATVVAVSASLAFMLPVATPPNAVVFGSGYVTVPQMARVGFVLNLVGVLFVAVAAAVLLPLVWGAPL
jgi:sodium-dependent dicarboxylate transporter 2/3/5